MRGQDFRAQRQSAIHSYVPSTRFIVLLDNGDALKQLDEIAAGAGASVTKLTIDGSPAIQWRKAMPWPQRGAQASSTANSGLTINTAIAAGIS